MGDGGADAGGDGLRVRFFGFVALASLLWLRCFDFVALASLLASPPSFPRKRETLLQRRAALVIHFDLPRFALALAFAFAFAFSSGSGSGSGFGFGFGFRSTPLICIEP